MNGNGDDLPVTSGVPETRWQHTAGVTSFPGNANMKKHAPLFAANQDPEVYRYG